MFTGKKPFVKIGMELYYAEGPEIVREIKKAISIPLFVKLTPEGGKIAQIATALYDKFMVDNYGIKVDTVENAKKSFVAENNGYELKGWIVDTINGTGSEFAKPDAEEILVDAQTYFDEYWEAQELAHR